MRIITVDAVSANGKITRGDNTPSHTWTSAEDWTHFQKLRDSFDLIVMGRKTYEVVRPKPEPTKLRVVLTHHPEDFAEAAVPGQLEFMNESPEGAINILERRGFSRLLLAGGRVNTAFWEAGLVDESYITIEPLLFGKGQNLAEGGSLEATLRLQSVQQLNKRGTLLVHYLVDKPERHPLS